MEFPSLLRMVKNFTEELTDYIAAGAPAVTPEQYQKRLEACNNCPLLKKQRCTLCGCVVEYKAKWGTANCPDTPSKWEEISPDE